MCSSGKISLIGPFIISVFKYIYIFFHLLPDVPYVESSSSLDRPKSATLQTMLSDTRILRAATS